MSTIGQFKIPTPPAAPSPTRAVPPPTPKPRYGGMAAAGSKNPFLEDLGVYLVVTKLFEAGQKIVGKNQVAKLEVEVLHYEGEANIKQGDVRFKSFDLEGDRSGPQGAQMAAYIISSLGYDNEAAFRADDPEGWTIDACLGYPSEKCPQPISLVGRPCWVRLSKGKRWEGKDGSSGHYTEYSFFPYKEPAATE